MAYIDSTFANNLNFESTLVPIKINLCLRVKVSYLRLHNIELNLAAMESFDRAI